MSDSPTKPPFDPSKPFQVADKPPFDPSKPYTAAPTVNDSSLTPSSSQQSSGYVPTLADLKNMVPSPSQVPELLGSMAGSLAKETPVGIGLSALGAAGGEAGRQLGQRAGIFEGQPPQTSADAAKQILYAGIRGAAGETVGRGVGKLFTPFSGSVTPELEAGRQAAESVGIKPPLSAMSESPMVQGMERVGEYTPFGSMITKQKDKALADFTDYASKVGQNIAPDKDPTITGSLAKEQLQGFVDKFNQTKDTLYNGVMPMLKDKPIQTDNTISALQDIIARRSGTAEPSGINQLKEWLSEIKPGTYERPPNSRPSFSTGNIPENLPKSYTDPLTGQLIEYEVPGSVKSVTGIRPSGGIPSNVPPDVLSGKFDIPGNINTFQGLRNFRTNVGFRTKFGDPATAGLQADLKQLYGAVSQDLDNSVKTVSPESFDALKQADETYQIGKSTLKSKIFKALSALNPEDMWKAVITPNSPTNVEMGKDILGKDTFNTLSKQWFDNVVQKSTTNDGVVSPLKLANGLNKYGSTIESMFSDNQPVLDQINKLKDVATLLSKGRQVTGGSQTAYIGAAMGETIGSIIALLNNPSWHTVGTIAGTFAGSGLGVKGMTSDVGRELMTRGYPAVGNIATRTIQPSVQLGLQKMTQGQQMFEDAKQRLLNK